MPPKTLALLPVPPLAPLPVLPLALLSTPPKTLRRSNSSLRSKKPAARRLFFVWTRPAMTPDPGSDGHPGDAFILIGHADIVL